MDTATTTAQLTARANHHSTVAMDTWKLGAITATTFREVSEGCLAATKALRDGDTEEAERLLDEAAALLDYLA